MYRSFNTTKNMAEWISDKFQMLVFSWRVYRLQYCKFGRKLQFSVILFYDRKILNISEMHNYQSQSITYFNYSHQ